VYKTGGLEVRMGSLCVRGLALTVSLDLQCVNTN
jgi:hypothetical protein